MSSAVLFLVVNFVIATCFSAVFAVISVYSRWRRVAMSFAIGLGVASLTMLFEFGVAYAADARPWSAGVYGTVLAGIVFLWAGIEELYRKPVSVWHGVLVFVAGMAIYFITQNIPRGTWLYPVLYQGSYAAVVFAGTYTVFRSSRREPLDRALGFALLVGALHFLVKAGLAVALGSGDSPKDYISTHYAIASQSITAIIIVAVGLLLLAILTVDLMAEERGKAERDSLSGLRNRRGFEKDVQVAMLGPVRGPHSVILCDLDHFKSINDTYGHHAGDAVIIAFGSLLNREAPAGAILGRIGGEEFAIFLPNTELSAAVAVAERLRSGIRGMDVPGMPQGFVVSASFGVSTFSGDKGFEDAVRNADAALYDAKRAGRNRVQTFQPARVAVAGKWGGLSIVR
jgi:diguanylate cyclase (GGDEF) domain